MELAVIIGEQPVAFDAPETRRPRLRLLRTPSGYAMVRVFVRVLVRVRVPFATLISLLVRIPSADALRIAHGGKGNGTGTNNTGGAGPCGTATVQKTTTKK